MLGSEATELGRGGIKTVAEATGAHPDTVTRGGPGACGRSGAGCSGAGLGCGRKKLSEPGLAVTVAHLPPDTSKWNKIEHRLFSQITLNWRGRPPTSHQVTVDLIANTTTATGLSVRAVLDTGQYPTGISYSDKDIAAIPLVRHDFHGDWNDTLLPHDTP